MRLRERACGCWLLSVAELWGLDWDNCGCHVLVDCSCVWVSVLVSVMQAIAQNNTDLRATTEQVLSAAKTSFEMKLLMKCTNGLNDGLGLRQCTRQTCALRKNTSANLRWDRFFRWTAGALLGKCRSNQKWNSSLRKFAKCWIYGHNSAMITTILKTKAVCSFAERKRARNYRGKGNYVDLWNKARPKVKH